MKGLCTKRTNYAIWLKEAEAIDTNQNKQRSPIALYLSLPILSWAFYDFANTIFSSNINTVFFPFYMDETIGTNAEKQQLASTFNPSHLVLTVIKTKSVSSLGEPVTFQVCHGIVKILYWGKFSDVFHPSILMKFVPWV